MNADNNFHIWEIPLDILGINLNDCFQKLSQEEKKVAMRFQFEKHRRRYIISHAAMREIFSTYLNVPNSEITVHVAEHGKPYLENNPLYFNLSHSHEMALLGLSFQGNVGVDIEYMNPSINFMSIAERYFTPEEVSQLKDVPLEARYQHFYLCWSAKEAYLKAKGIGIATHLKMFTLGIQTLNEIKILTINQEIKEFSTWFVQSMCSIDGYVATVVSTVKPALLVNHKFVMKNRIK